MQEFSLLLLNKEVAGGNVMLNVTVCGLVIVFMVLLLLVAVIGVFGAIVGRKTKPARKDNKQQNALAATNTEDEQTVAVITAAVYSYYQNSSVKPLIRSIKPSKQNGGRGVWQQAGMRQNMQPF